VLLNPDGDIVRHLLASGQASEHPGWACYHTTLWTFDLDGTEVGVIGCAVGASFAVLLAEQLHASGGQLLVSVTSSGSITTVADPPHFVLIDRALRDEGTSHHYLPPGTWSGAPPPPNGIPPKPEGVPCRRRWCDVAGEQAWCPRRLRSLASVSSAATTVIPAAPASARLRRSIPMDDHRPGSAPTAASSSPPSDTT
jgi:hypothetical protein